MIDSAISAVFARFAELFLWLNDPFWGWLWLGIAIMLAVSLIVYFFGSWFPALRPIGGVILLLVSFGLYAYRKGEADRAALDKKRPPPKLGPKAPRRPF